MSEATAGTPDDQPLSFDPRWAGFASELVLWTDNPPRGDETQRAFADAAFTGLVEKPEVRKALHELVQNTWQQSDMGPSHTVNLLHSALEYHVRDDPNAPFRSTGAWAELLDEQLCNPPLWRRIERTMRRPLMSVKPQRNVMTHALSHLLFDGRVRLLDAGGSNGHGLAAMSTAAFTPVEVMSVPPGEEVPQGDPEAQIAINALLAQPIDVETNGSTTIDMMSRERLGAWIRTCTLRGLEKLDPAVVNRYNELDIVARALPFYKANLASSKQMQRFTEASGGPFDYVSAKTILNPHSPRTQAAILKNVRVQTGEGAIEEVADFVLPDPNDPTRLNFIRHWFKEPYAYSVLVRRPPAQEWQLVASFDTSRGRRILLHNGNIAREGEPPVTVRELLLGRAAPSK